MEGVFFCFGAICRVLTLIKTCLTEIIFEERDCNDKRASHTLLIPRRPGGGVAGGAAADLGGVQLLPPNEQVPEATVAGGAGGVAQRSF